MLVPLQFMKYAQLFVENLIQLLCWWRLCGLMRSGLQNIQNLVHRIVSSYHRGLFNPNRIGVSAALIFRGGSERELNTPNLFAIFA